MRAISFALLGSLLFGCPAPQSPRHVARGAVLSVAYGVQVADRLCAERARQIAGIEASPVDDKPTKDLPVESKSASVIDQAETRSMYTEAISIDKDKLEKAIELATKCEKGYDAARHGLLAAASAVDAWGDVEKNGEVACGVSEGVTGLNHIVEAVEAAGVKMPPAVQDAQIAATFVAGLVEMKACKVRK